jgi:hypothetical protein
VTEHDVLVGYPCNCFTLTDDLGSVRHACRPMGVHRSTR